MKVFTCQFNSFYQKNKFFLELAMIYFQVTFYLYMFIDNFLKDFFRKKLLIKAANNNEIESLYIPPNNFTKNEWFGVIYHQPVYQETNSSNKKLIGFAMLGIWIESAVRNTILPIESENLNFYIFDIINSGQLLLFISDSNQTNNGILILKN